MTEDKLNSKTYQTILQRMQTEEATCALLEGSRRDEEYVTGWGWRVGMIDDRPE